MFGTERTVWGHPDEAHPHAASALAITAQRIADKQRRVRVSAKHLQGRLKDLRIGFFRADAMTVDQTRKQRSQAGALTHGFEIAIEIRDHSQPIPVPQFLQYWTIMCEGGRCFRQETRCYPLAASIPERSVASSASIRQLHLDIGNQRMHRSRKIGFWA